MQYARELRKPLTPSEAILWEQLHKKQLGGFKFRRRHPIYRFILDFYCPSLKLAVEVDSEYHNNSNQQLYDQARTDWLNRRGITVIRVANQQVNTDLTGVLRKINAKTVQLPQENFNNAPISTD